VRQRAWSGIGWLYEWRTSKILPYLWEVSSITSGQSLIYQLHDSASDLPTNHVRRELFGLRGNPDKHFRGNQDSQSNSLPHGVAILYGAGQWVSLLLLQDPLQESVQCKYFVLSLCLRPIFNAQLSSEMSPTNRQCTQSVTSAAVPTFVISRSFRGMPDDLNPKFI
jgi:hypothetical protein